MYSAYISVCSNLMLVSSVIKTAAGVRATPGTVAVALPLGFVLLAAPRPAGDGVEGLRIPVTAEVGFFRRLSLGGSCEDDESCLGGLKVCEFPEDLDPIDERLFLCCGNLDGEGVGISDLGGESSEADADLKSDEFVELLLLAEEILLF